MTQSDMIPFVTPAGGWGLILAYLDPPLGTGVQTTPVDLNRIITWNGQYFPLIDQGNEELKTFYNNIPPCHGISPQAVRL